MIDQLDIIKNIDTIYNSNSSISVLKDFERVLDELDLYVYDNWIDGELVDGPIVKRHWITVSFMWPRDKMPDPMGGKRLLDYGCEIKYEKTHMLEPRKITKPDDYRPGTRKGKMDRTPVWVVHITMSKELVQEMYDGYMGMMKHKMGVGNGSTHAEAAAPQPAEAMQAQMQQPAMAAPMDMGGGTNVPA